jgi:hypothetical protein
LEFSLRAVSGPVAFELRHPGVDRMPDTSRKPVVLLFLACFLLGGSAAFAYQPEPAPENDEVEEPEPAPEEVSPLLFEPETAEQYFDAVLISLRLALPNLARQYLEGFMELEPDDEVLLELRDRHGPAVFLNLANQRELRPLSTELLDRVNAAFRRRAEDPIASTRWSPTWPARRGSGKPPSSRSATPGRSSSLVFCSTCAIRPGPTCTACWSTC